MTMVKRILLLVLCGAVLLPGTADAATALHGRSPAAQAALDATLWRSSRPVQVLTSLCTRPSKLRGCAPISGRMRTALEEALNAPITWVDQRRVRGPEFLVFAPVAYAGSDAKAEVAYWDPGANGCFGGYETRFRRGQGAWSAYLWLGWAGCSANA
jgi:hypothetical protein